MLKLLGGLNFAHLRGLGRAKAEDDAARAAASSSDEGCEDDEEMQAEETAEDKDADETDETAGKKGKKAKTKAKAKPADETDDDEDGDDPDDDDTDETDDGDDGEDAKKGARKAAARARKMERARCASIFASPAAAGNVELAAKLAFTTDLSASAAKAILEATPARGHGLRDRMAGAPQTRVPPGSGKTSGGQAATDAMWSTALAGLMPAKQ